ncbi:CYP704C1 protein [Hibiscus syriacus]|uniref:CYP704C1 protein n=1 Tax=Hibiscus syriacus TaxID=106335 RepID=A0A6A3CAA0_HIBSY|nr:pentatricopeptide repeat-containing protein At5g66520-like [Hibiscus syriacus]KAE8724019.1 CYP704C1 protein [Hibiscus syriacus]
MVEPKCPTLKATITRLIEEFKVLKELKQIHAHIIISPKLSKAHRDFLTTRLLFASAFSESGSLCFATRVFKFIQNPTLSVYNIMIRAYASKTRDSDNTHNFEPLLLFKQMLFSGISPDCITFPFVIKECAGRLDSRVGCSIHGEAVKFGWFCDVYVQNSLVSFYSECGFLNSARKLFDEMPKRDVVSWNSIIIGYLRGGNLDMALELFRRMEKRNIISWNSMITGFVQGRRGKEALQLFHEMQNSSNDNVKPDKITMASVLSACAYLGAIAHGKWIHGYLSRSVECDVVVGTALVDMYGKCGSVERAYEVFKEMPKRDTLAWTAMISAFAQHGYSKEAFSTFEEMEAMGVKPNHVTFLGLLSACAHSGMVEEGRWCFNMMKRVYSIEPQIHHYASMVDVLSRAGLFEEVEELIRSMQMEPDVFVWGALLGGCQIHGNLELGERIAKYLINLEPMNHTFYINLCDIYAKSGRFDDVKRMRALMKARGIRKEVAGCSLIEVDGLVLEFSVEGCPVPVMDEIVVVLNLFKNEMKGESTLHYYYGILLDSNN